MAKALNRFTDVDTEKKNLTPIYGYWSHPVLPLEQALQPITPMIPQLERYIKVAKENCAYPSEHNLTRDESASLYIYTMEWGPTSLYRVLNKALRTEDRTVLKPWFGYLKLFESAFDKLPNLEKVVWRGVRKNVGQDFKNNETITWWSVNSCSASVHVVKNFLDVDSTLFLIEASNGKDVSKYTNFPNEDEVLLCPGTNFKVVGDGLDHVGGLHVVHLREVNEKDKDESAAPKNNTVERTSTKNIVDMAFSIIKKSDFTKVIKRNIAGIYANENSTKHRNIQIVHYPNGDRYEGTFKDGKKHGKGTYYFLNGDIYTGEWDDDRMEGQGSFKWIYGNSYVGQYKNGKMHGSGTFYFSNGERYEGDWYENMRNGEGKYFWPNGNIYEGPHKNNNFHGHGKLTTVDGQVRKGTWKNNVFVG